MKKIVYIILAGVIALISCAKESTNENEKGTSRKVVLSALAENQATKATLGNDSRTWIWSSNDQIVVYYLRGDAKWNQQMNLKSSSANQTVGEFETPDGFTYYDDMCWNVGAIYPYSGNEVVYYDNRYLANVELKSSYDYIAGQVLMPLVANLSTSGENQPSSIQFKQVASAVKVTLKNVPVGTKSVTLTADKNIAGKCNINISDAGTGTVSAPYNSASKSITFNFATLSSVASEMVFYFPIVPIETPTLTISLTNDSNEVFWSRTATDQHSLGRGDILDMDALTVPSTKKLNIGLIEYLNTSFCSGLQVHYWYGSGSGAGDSDITQETGTIRQDVGYWDDTEHNFNKFSATIPIIATKFHIHKGNDYSSYNNYGGDRDYSKQTLFIFEYGGTYHYDFH